MSRFIKCIFRFCTSNPIIYLIGVYLFFIFILNPFGEYVVNDEWAHTRQVEAFTHHVWRIQANTDAVLILQALAGYAVTLVFGYSFTVLKMSVFLVFLTSIIGLYRISKLLTNNNTVVLITILIYIFNPLVMHLNSVFMTDIPFLTLNIWSLYFFILFLQTSKTESIYIAPLKLSVSKQYLLLFLGSGFAIAGILIRQVGIILFASILVTLVTQALLRGSLNKNALTNISTVLIAALISVAIYAIWPRFNTTNNSYNLGGLNNLIEDLMSGKDLLKRTELMLKSICYFGFFTYPLTLGGSIILNKSLKYQRILLFIIPVAIGVLLGIWIYKLNLFPIGNILYFEGLYAKATQIRDLNILNNNLIKLVVSVLSGMSIIQVAIIMVFAIKERKTTFFSNLRLNYGDPHNSINLKDLSRNSGVIFFIFNTFLGYLFILLLGNDMYDRYLLPSFVSLLALLLLNRNQYKTNYRITTILLFSYIIISYCLVFDYTTTIRLRWETAKEITKATGIKTKILVDGTFAKYKSAEKMKDYTGLVYVDSAADYICVTEISHDKTDTISSNIIRYPSKWIKHVFGEPEEIKAKKSLVPYVEKEKKLNIIKKHYYSPIYNLIGSVNTIEGWCNKTELEQH